MLKIKISKFPHSKNLRDVIKSIILRDLKSVRHKKVLEIGCGTWDYAKKIIEKNNCMWFGIEPVNEGNKNITLIKGSVKNIPFHDDSFDIVVCNQTMEHWFEYNVSLNEALKEIYRVLKPGGIVMINSPIHLHGDPRFLRGELIKIRKHFRKNFWSIVLFETCFPSIEIQGWKRIASKGFFSNFGYPSFLLGHNNTLVSYILNIHAKKKLNKKSTKDTKKSISRQLMVILRFLKVYIRTRLFTY